MYCRPGGEGRINRRDDYLGRDEIRFLLEVATDLGYGWVKFTGGEPLLRPDIADMVADAVSCANAQDVQLVTNGTLLVSRAPALGAAGVSSITISLDAADPALFKEMTGGGEFSAVIDGIQACRSLGITVRINTVVTTRNYLEIPALAEVARQHRTSLKLIDVVDLSAPFSGDSWSHQFLPFEEVHKLLRSLGAINVGLELTPGGIGSPTQEYRFPDGLQVVVKDAMFGACYTESCRDCAHYPCQDAVISIRVTHDGFLKRCLVRDDNLLSIRGCLLNRDRQSLRAVLDEVLQEYRSSTFVPNAWKPTNSAGCPCSERDR